jgi:branched-chain amino acid transport system ATP-binding protein
MTALLEVSALTKSFGGLLALDQVDLTVRHRHIKGLIGPNGAGKTTLFNVIGGFLTATSGDVWLDGERITGRPANERAQRGVARTFQKVKLFRGMTVLEHAMVGCHQRSRAGMVAAVVRLPWVRAEEQRIREEARQVLSLVNLHNKENELAVNLPFGQQRLLEIARALAMRPKLLLMDEPAAGLNTYETEVLGQLIRSLADRAVTVLLVEHNMGLVMDVSDEVAVLDFGRVIADDHPTNVQRDPAVIHAYLGGDVREA